MKIYDCSMHVGRNIINWSTSEGSTLALEYGRLSDLLSAPLCVSFPSANSELPVALLFLMKALACLNWDSSVETLSCLPNIRMDWGSYVGPPLFACCTHPQPISASKVSFRWP